MDLEGSILFEPGKFLKLVTKGLPLTNVAAFFYFSVGNCFMTKKFRDMQYAKDPVIDEYYPYSNLARL